MLVDFIKDATIEVFDTMVMMEIVPGEERKVASSSLQTNISSMIGLAGDLRGVLAIHCPDSVARAITGSLLGMVVEELDEDVKDAIGEIANMVAGGLKASLATQGTKVNLALPATVIGNALRMSHLAAGGNFFVPFSTTAGEFGVELRYIQG
jgi:chemotaxis protein CheX